MNRCRLVAMHGSTTGTDAAPAAITAFFSDMPNNGSVDESLLVSRKAHEREFRRWTNAKA